MPLALLLAASAATAVAEAPQTVVVTATRVEQAGADVPASIDTVPGERFRNANMRVNLSESLGRVPGIVVQNRYNYAQDLQVSSRGFGARASFGVRGVRLLQDGIPLTMPDGQGQTGLFDLDGAARVEVLRGPLAALYGNSSGGVIQLVTEDAPQSPSLELSGSGAEFGTWRGGMKFRGRLNGLGVTANLSRFETDGWRARSGARRDVANVKLSYDLGDRSRVLLLANFLDQPDTEDPLGLTRSQFDSDPRQPAANAIELGTRKSIRHRQAGVVLQHAWSSASRLQLMAYGGARDLVQYLANPSATLTGSGGVVDLDRGFGGAGVQWRRELDLRGTRASLTLGADFDRMDEHRRGFVNAGGTRGDLRRDEDDRVESLNQFALADWWPTARWKLSAGLRNSRVSFRSDDHFVVGPNPDDSGSLSYSSTQPVVGVLFHPRPDIDLYASAGRGFETPTFSELAYRPDGTPGLNLALEAARNSSAEAGIRFRAHERAQLHAAAFRADTRDDIVAGPALFPGRTTFVNADRTRREGLELAAEGSFPANVEAYLGYTLTAARFVRFTNSNGEDLSGRRIPGVPRHAIYADLSWKPAVAGFTTGLETRWVSEVPVDDVNSDAAASYVTVSWHAGLAQRLGAWRMREFVRVDNLSNERYAGSVVVNAANGRYFEPAPDRSVMVGFEAAFDPGSDRR